METILIRGGTVVLGHRVSHQDLLIKGEKIATIGDLSDLRADKTLDAEGLLVLPGGVDTHVHFNDVFMSTISVHDYYTGTLAAAFGGTTTVLDYVGHPVEQVIRLQGSIDLPVIDLGQLAMVTLASTV